MIFNQFTKIEISDSNNVYRGIGLGLSIVLKLVHLMGGRISLDSELDVGTTFFLSFPFSDQL